MIGRPTGSSPYSAESQSGTALAEDDGLPPDLFAGEDPFADVDWAAQKRLIMSRLPERPAIASEPRRGPISLGVLVQYAMLAAGLVLSVSLLITMARQHQALQNRRGPAAARFAPATSDSTATTAISADAPQWRDPALSDPHHFRLPQDRLPSTLPVEFVGGR